MCKRLCFLIFFILLLGLVQVGTANDYDPDTDPSLLCWWKLDETSGTTAVDSAGGDHDGTFSEAGLAWVPRNGRIEGALEFGAFGAGYVTFSTRGMSVSNGTVALWANLGPEQTIPDTRYFFGHTTEPTYANRIQLYMDGGTDLDFGLGAGHALAMNMVTLEIGRWYHIVFTWNEYGTYVVYLDGEQLATGTFGGLTTLNTFAEFGSNGNPAHQQGFMGLLDDVRVYTRALSQAEIRTLSDVPQYKATQPYPTNGEMLASITDITLTWTPGDTADSHHVYVGESFEDVFNGTENVDQGIIPDASLADYPWEIDKTYYWRVDEVEADGAEHLGSIWTFTILPRYATRPVPADGTKFVDPSGVELSWTSGGGATYHYVYFSDNLQLVQNADKSVRTLRQDPNYPIDQRLKDGTTYYWRVNEWSKETGVISGDVWSFTTIPQIPIADDPNLVGYWNFDENEGSVAVDWSGHGNHGQMNGEPLRMPDEDPNALYFDGLDDHIIVPQMVGDDFTLMAWIKADQEQVAVGTQTAGHGAGLIWTDDVESSNDYGLAIYSTILCFYVGDDASLNSTREVVTGDWVHVAAVRRAGSMTAIYIDGTPDGTATHTNTASLNADPTISIGANMVNARLYKGLMADIRIYDKAMTQEEIIRAMRIDLLIAWNPSPASGSTPDIEHATPLEWFPGENAAQHDVYFGTDENAVRDANTSDTTGIYRDRQDANSYTPPEALDPGQTYYWRIDEYNNDETISKGKLWSLTITDYLVLDDFEQYNDTDNRIFETWQDGYGWRYPSPGNHGNGTGSMVDVSTTIIQSGSQSLRCDYDNDGSFVNAFGEASNPYYSEIFHEWDDPQDLTRRDVKALSLWFRGYPTSASSFSTDDPRPGIYTMTADGAGITGDSDEFYYAFKQLSGVGSIKAQVLAMLNTDDWAKAGVMIRETLDVDSAYVMISVTPGQGVVYEYRDIKGANSTQAAGQQTDVTAPHWVKITRTGNTFTAEHSTDGTYWQVLGPVETIPLSADTYIGLALTSTNADAMCKAQFSDVTIDGTVTEQWQPQDIGIKSNVAEQLYVKLEDSTGNTEAVNHPDPNAVLLDTWQEWNIKLQDFNDAGVNTKSIKKMHIGVGDEDAQNPGGTGILYIDDIRLYGFRCVAELAKPVGDFNDNCVVDYFDLQIMTDNWLLSEYDVTPVAPSDANLLAYYALENNMLDGSGNGHHGEPCSAPLYVPGQLGSAIQFDGIDDAVVTNESLLNNMSEFTLAGWVSAANPDAGRIGLFGQNDSIEFGYWDGGVIRVWTSGGGEAKTAWTFPNLTWHHVAVVGDGASLNIYIDGQLEVIGGEAAGNYGESTYGFNIGGGGIWNDPNDAGDWFDGQIDEVRVYSRALSQGEIGSLAGKTAVYTQPLDMLLSPQDPVIDMNSDGTIGLKDYTKLASIWLEELLWP